jgi:protein SCO1/2
VCPTLLQALSDGLDLIDENSIKVRPVFITIDPERDKPEVLKSYLENFHPLITGLTGNSGEIEKVAKAFGIYYAKAKENKKSKEDYLMDHTGGIILIGPNGEFITKISHTASPDEIVREIRTNL